MLADKSYSGTLVGGMKDPYNVLIEDTFSGALCLALISDLKCRVAGSPILSSTE